LRQLPRESSEMYDTKRDIVDALVSAPEVLTRLVGDLAARAEIPLRNPSGWTLLEIVCHLRDAEERALERTRLMRDTDGPKITSYDPALWAVERAYASQDLATAVSEFRSLREAHVSELEAISFEDWQRGGSHAEYGDIDIIGHAIHIMSHDANHLRQIAQLAR
jgi:hypothetical protein